MSEKEAISHSDDGESLIFLGDESWKNLQKSLSAKEKFDQYWQENSSGKNTQNVVSWIEIGPQSGRSRIFEIKSNVSGGTPMPVTDVVKYNLEQSEKIMRRLRHKG